jgi:hypothetical protein
VDAEDTAEEREAARAKAERLATLCQEWGLPLNAIAWQREGAPAWVAIRGVRIGCLKTLPSEKQHVLEDIRRR